MKFLPYKKQSYLIMIKTLTKKMNNKMINKNEVPFLQLYIGTKKNVQVYTDYKILTVISIPLKIKNLLSPGLFI